MYKRKRILGVITARGGSKGLPGKNIRYLHGKPLIAWTVAVAQESQYLDSFLVSTDSAEIAEISKSYGAQVPFLRPAELSTDKASSIDVVLHAIDNSKEVYDWVMILQPTSPLRSAADIDVAIELADIKKADSIVSVCPNEHHPWLSNTLPADGNMKCFLRQETQHRTRQEFPTYYRLNGAIFLTKISILRETRSFFGPQTFAYEMPVERSIDIDHLIDFKLAECYLETQNALHLNK